MKWVIADYEEVIFDLKGIVSVYKYIYTPPNKSFHLTQKIHVKACHLLAKKMQHLCWNVPSSHQSLKITAYNVKCSKSCPDSLFLEMCKIWQSSMAKEF